MRLHDIYEAKKHKGTYAGVHFDYDTKKRIEKYIKDNKIPNPVPLHKLHNTLIYSKKYLPKFEAQGRLDPPWIGEPTEFDVFTAQPDENGKRARCLVLKFECAQCTDRHHEIMDKHGATFDYDEYTPHITFSYDIGDMDIKDLPDPVEAIGDIKIVDEYQEDLNLNWAKDNT